ncbi:MAG: hypothetical protein EBR67_07005 [Proteobacteria bacterium]|jgi:hypothetical protein|nr:hypothetical protein [Pseudomonadota bacterium]
MSGFEEFFANLEEKLKATSRIGLLQKANEENRTQYKVNKLLLYWFKLRAHKNKFIAALIFFFSLMLFFVYTLIRS